MPWPSCNYFRRCSLVVLGVLLLRWLRFKSFHQGLVESLVTLLGSLVVGLRGVLADLLVLLDKPMLLGALIGSLALRDPLLEGARVQAGHHHRVLQRILLDAESARSLQLGSHHSLNL